MARTNRNFTPISSHSHHRLVSPMQELERDSLPSPERPFPLRSSAVGAMGASLARARRLDVCRPGMEIVRLKPELREALSDLAARESGSASSRRWATSTAGISP
jgi:hypothetical protein